MRLYTSQICNHKRLAYAGFTFIDTTVKSGVKWLAPQWSYLMKYKEDGDEQSYTECYTNDMRASYQKNQQLWLDLLNNDEIVLLCYCPSGKFCHRLLLVEFLRKVAEKHNIPFEYAGELRWIEKTLKVS